MIRARGHGVSIVNDYAETSTVPVCGLWTCFRVASEFLPKRTSMYARFVVDYADTTLALKEQSGESPTVTVLNI